ncbi:hypothetical protein Smp_163150 [Schistosoma mansoni]|uniref:Uncharacterized protein n=1 Tax=Schistosoma mansoni TaxID=6183 RepID=G4VSU7_SCHMA|nr:hypothetical protein Smp_163150 [Schistosoma mansoni]|eukprot:XP_018655527.1 hypothetical protein Smp_163150 [Schistosoma mansoni]
MTEQYHKSYHEILYIIYQNQKKRKLNFLNKI